jgi:hypothetical protein
MQPLQWASAVAALAFVPSFALAQSAEDESANFSTEMVLSGLDSPWGLAIRAGRGKAGPHELFLAESGAGRVIRVTTDQPGKVRDVVVGFPVSASTTSSAIHTGPLGLAFLTRTKLLVTGVGGNAGQREVRVYVLPGDDAELAADSYDHLASAARSGAELRDLWAVVTSPAAAYFTAGGVQGEGWIFQAKLEANRLEALRPFVSPRRGGDLMNPAGITLTPADRPPFLVVADEGSFDTPHDSRLIFYTLETGSLALRLSTGLDDVTALAYSPSGQLYALDRARNETGQGGVYRLDDVRHEGRQACRAVKIAAVVSGVSMAFAPDGALYVTSLGKGENSKQGALTKITGEF